MYSTRLSGNLTPVVSSSPLQGPWGRLRGKQRRSPSGGTGWMTFPRPTVRDFRAAHRGYEVSWTLVISPLGSPREQLASGPPLQQVLNARACGCALLCRVGTARQLRSVSNSCLRWNSISVESCVLLQHPRPACSPEGSALNAVAREAVCSLLRRSRLFDRKIERQGADPNRRSGVLSLVTEYGHHEIGEAVHHQVLFDVLLGVLLTIPITLTIRFTRLRFPSSCLSVAMVETAVDVRPGSPLRSSCPVRVCP